MASSAFSFHCMICFEEFDPDVNYPVVLPCGHTYVCATCAGRIDMCMECRAPLVARIDVPGSCGPAPPPPPGEAPPGRENNQSAYNQAGGSAYSNRVRNSPGFRRRYGNQYGLDARPPGPPASSPGQAAKPTVVKHRLPLPKNAVLLSLIQVSEPARRRMEVEAPPTPEKDGEGGPSSGPAGSRTPSPGDGGTALPRFSQPSPLFVTGSPGGRGGTPGDGGGHLDLTLGGSLDDEERKIRVGTYLEGGPCGTYAVASKSGLLVYPTLFEHTLPDAMGGGRDRDNDVARGVEDIVKKHRSRSRGKKKKEKEEAGTPGDDGRRKSLGVRSEPDDLLHSISEGRKSHETLVEPSASHDAIEARASSVEHDDPAVPGGLLAAMSISNDEEADVFPSAGSPLTLTSDRLAGLAGGMERMTAMSDPGLSLSVSLTSDDDEEDDDDAYHGGDAPVAAPADVSGDTSDGSLSLVDRLNISTRSTPVKRLRSAAISPVKSKDDSSTLRRFARHFTTGSSPGRAGGDGSDGEEGHDENEFERPLIRLKYGDRVQVVSMDGRGWVKLARGYGYIRLENDKQLVKGESFPVFEQIKEVRVCAP